MRVLVTHPSSDLGRLLVADLRRHGHDVTTVDGRDTARRPVRPRLAGHRAAARPWHEVGEVVRRVRPTAVIHLAAAPPCAPALDGSPAAAGRYDLSQVARTAHLLDAAAAHGVSRLVLASSWTVYGSPQVSPIDERALPRPTTLAAEALLACERLTVAHARTTGTGYAVLRCFTPVGAAGRRRGADGVPGTDVIGRAVRAAFTGARLEIRGTGSPTGDGTAIRDYVHVADVARAHLAALERCAPRGGASGVWNVGSGTPISDLDVVREVERVTGRRIAATVRPMPAAVPAVGVADPGAVAADLGWTPRHDLTDMVRSAVDLFRVLPGRGGSRTSWTSS